MCSRWISAQVTSPNIKDESLCSGHLRSRLNLRVYACVCVHPPGPLFQAVKEISRWPRHHERHATLSTKDKNWRQCCHQFWLNFGCLVDLNRPIKQKHSQHGLLTAGCGGTESDGILNGSSLSIVLVLFVHTTAWPEPAFVSLPWRFSSTHLFIYLFIYLGIKIIFLPRLSRLF